MTRLREAGNWAALGLVLAGCGARPTTRSPRIEEPRTPATAPQSWRIARYPAPPRGPQLVEVAAGGVRRLLIGGLRAEQRGKAIVFAEQSTVESIVLSCRADDGFLHRAADGRFFWSPTFLGKLEPGGFIGKEAWGRLEQCGPVLVTVRGKTRRLVTHQGVTTLPANDFAYVRFSTPLVGRAHATPDRLLQTSDGGRTFREPSPRPTGSASEPEAWLGGSLEARNENADPDEQSPEAMEAWLRRSVASETGRMMEGLRLDDGSWVRSAQDYHHTYVAFRSAAGRITSYAVEGTCELSPWGERVLADCRQNQPLDPVALTPDGVVSLPVPPAHPYRLIADPRGKLLIGVAQHQDGDGKRHDSLLRFDGQRWIATELNDAGPLALVGGTLLLTTGEQLTKVVPFEQPDQPGIALPGHPYTAYGSLNISWLVGSVGYLNGKPSGNPSELIWAELGSAPVGLRRYPLSFEARHIDFADAHHGVAIDVDGKVWLTQDAGQNFARVASRDDRTWSSTLRCWDHGCALAGNVAWTNEPLADTNALPSPPATAAELAADLAANPPESSAATSAAPAADESASPWQAPKTNAPLYVCHASPALPKGDQLLRRLLDAHEAANGGEQLAVGRANTLLGLIRRQGEGLAWTAHDDQGDFSVEIRVVTGPAANLLNDTTLKFLPRDLALEPPTLVPLLVTRRFALLQTLTFAENQLLLVRVDGTSALLFASKGMNAAVLRSAGGNVAVHASAGGRQELVWLDAEGKELARRWLLSADGLLMLDANEPSAPWFAAATANGLRLFSFAPGSDSRPLSIDLRQAFPECSKPAAAGAFLTSLGGFYGPRIDVDGLRSQPLAYPTHWAQPSTADGLLEINRNAGCYRGALMSDPVPLELHVGARGGLSGVLIGPERTHSVTCRRAPAPGSAE